MNHSNRNTWWRLRRNKGALFGLIIIGLSIFVAVAAYFIAPDFSPDANRMIVEIGGRKPGFTQKFIRLKKEKGPAPVSFMQRLVSGKEDEYSYIPVNDYTRKGDSLIVRKYIDEGVEERGAYPVSALQINSAPSGDPYIETR